MLQPITTRFDEQTHTYTSENGQVLPSVSKIVETGKHFDFIPKDRQQEIMKRGSMLHQNIEYFVTTGDTAGDAQLEMFAQVYDEVQKMFGKYVASETPLAAAYLGMQFAGKPDIVLERAVVEIKSSLGSAERVYGMQLAAYGMLCLANNVCKPVGYVICYRNNGKWAYKVLPKCYGGVTLQDAFIAALNKYYNNKVLEQYLNNL